MVDDQTKYTVVDRFQKIHGAIVETPNNSRCFFLRRCSTLDISKGMIAAPTSIIRMISRSNHNPKLCFLEPLHHAYNFIKHPGMGCFS